MTSSHNIISFYFPTKSSVESVSSRSSLYYILQ
nr:MAG TPA: hypothetical protein [Caudoviricetes sp.]